MEIREIKENELNELLALYSHLHSSDDPLPRIDVVNATWRKIQTNPNIQSKVLYVRISFILHNQHHTKSDSWLQTLWSHREYGNT